MRDKTLAKYFLENFKRKINELTPNVNNRNNYFKFKRKFNPLKETKELYKKRDKFGEKELKELSILFLIINNLDVFRKNIELISEVDFAEQSLIDFKERAFFVWWSATTLGEGTKITAFFTTHNSEIAKAPALEITISEHE